MGALGTVLQVVSLEPLEVDIFVDIASRTRLGDGEAACIAIALNRRIAFVSDDRAARNFLRSLRGDAELIDTPGLLKGWAATAPPERVRDAITNIEMKANFRIGRRHEHAQWWGSIGRLR